jgi:sugar O-acyltransferase (sialic acid O-acetyltransferase NeuD family)
MTTKIHIQGTAGNCIDILEAIEDINRSRRRRKYNCVGFLDDDRIMWGQKVHAKKVLGPLSKASSYRDCLLVNGIGSPFNYWRRDKIVATTRASLARFATIVHPSAIVSPSAILGKGVVVLPHVTIAANARIGHHVILLPNTIISHDASIGDYSCVAGGVCVSGGARIGRSCYLGTNSSVIGNVYVGDYCLVGMGSVVLKNVTQRSVVAGNPARRLKGIGTRSLP